MQEGYGACLIDKPELLRDVVLQTRNRIPSDDFTVSVKIRIHPDIRYYRNQWKKFLSLCFMKFQNNSKFMSASGESWPFLSYCSW